MYIDVSDHYGSLMTFFSLNHKPFTHPKFINSNLIFLNWIR